MTKSTPVGRAVPITTRAMLQRLDRKLRREGKTLKSPRGWADRSALGDYFIVNLDSGKVADCKLTEAKLEAMARKLGALRAWEEVQQ